MREGSKCAARNRRLIVPPRWLHTRREIWISVACRAQSRGRRITLGNRGKAAIDVIARRIGIQADRIIRVVGLSHRRRCADHSQGKDGPN